MNYHMRYPSPMGELLLTSDGRNLTGLWMDRQPAPQSIPGEQIPVLKQTQAWLDGYFRGEILPVTIPMAVEGTPFRKLIWKLLQEIPCGETCTYGELAKKAAAALGKERMSSQAVGGAAHRNPISILIPCHRCIGADGSLTGYAGGLERKQWLLDHERKENHDHQRIPEAGNDHPESGAE